MKKKVRELIEELRQEEYHWLKNNCVTKSFRLKAGCCSLGVPVKVVICLGYAKTNKWLRHWLTVPTIHAWCEIEGRRIEVARPLNELGLLGVPPGEIKPVVAVWI